MIANSHTHIKVQRLEMLFGNADHSYSFLQTAALNIRVFSGIGFCVICVRDSWTSSYDEIILHLAKLYMCVACVELAAKYKYRA